jgi:hypothetical protein
MDYGGTREGRRIDMMFRSCRRCQGDVYIEHLIGSEELVCLQCGHPRAVNRRPLGLVVSARIKQAA